jgi:mono/diheme cytochrome c family protein
MLKHLARYGTASLVLFAASGLCLAQTGADTYKSKCAMCHGPDGLGNTPAGKSTKARPFNAPEVVAASDDDLIAITKAGKAKMPAYGAKLTDAQIKDVVAYIRTLQK